MPYKCNTLAKVCRETEIEGRNSIIFPSNPLEVVLRKLNVYLGLCLFRLHIIYKCLYFENKYNFSKYLFKRQSTVDCVVPSHIKGQN